MCTASLLALAAIQLSAAASEQRSQARMRKKNTPGIHTLYIYISYVFRYTKDSPLRNVLPTLRSDLEVMQENGEATPLTPAPLSPAARRAELIWCMILPVPRHQSLTGIFFPETNWEK